MGFRDFIKSLFADPPHLRNLPVPFLSQRKNTYVFKGNYSAKLDGSKWSAADGDAGDSHLSYVLEGDVEVSMANRSCNITCIAMILHYFGITSDTPDTMMRNYFESTHFDVDGKVDIGDKSVMAFEWWEAVMEKIVNHTYNLKTNLYLTGCTIQDLKDHIAAGYPVMISIGIDAGKSGGHIAVVRGFTKIGSVEYIILNDPWGHVTNIEITYAEHLRKLPYETKPEHYSYDGYPYDNNGSNGDNVVLKMASFKKMIAKNGTINVAMVMYGHLWQKPNGKEFSGTDAVFPMNADFMWHSGIHLSIQKEIHSIGAGKLLAVRNSDAINGSASFMLVKHQVAKLTGEDENEVKVDKILPFYALYMHTDSIKIEDCAKAYFETGKLPAQYNFKWLLQLFSNMLPHVYVITNYNSGKLGGDLSTGYQTVGDIDRSIYEADIIDSFGLRHTNDDGNMIPASEQFHGQRMLVHLLPVNGLFQELLNPANYSNSSGFQDRMLNSDNFLKEIGNDKYIFFHNSNANTGDEAISSGIFCSKFYDANGVDDTGFFEKPITVNKSMFKRNAKILSQLYNDGSADSGKVVSFNELTNFPVASNTSAKEYLDGKADRFTLKHADTEDKIAEVETFDALLGDTFLTAQKTHWDAIFASRITDNTSLPLTDNVFTAMNEICADLVERPVDENNSKDNISAKLKKYFTEYSNARYATLKSFLTEKCAGIEAPKYDIHTWKYHLCTILNDCFSIIMGDDSKLFANVTLQTGDGVDIANTFVDKLKQLNLSLGYREIAIEMACCRLFNIPRENITDGENQYFKLSDTSISALLESYLSFNSFQIYEHYVDTVIEIPKNDIIGKCGRYNDEMDMIHFEIFSPKDFNIYSELGIDTDGLIVDESTDEFFNASHTIEKLKEYLPQEFDFLNVNIIRYYEFNQLKENNILSKYAVRHISEWSPTLTYEKYKETHSIRLPLFAHIRKDEEIKPFHVETTDETVAPDDDDGGANFKDKLCWAKDYFEQCAVPYHWCLETILGKKTPTNDFYIYYNPTYFLQQLVGKDEESRELHEPEDTE